MNLFLYCILTHFLTFPAKKQKFYHQTIWTWFLFKFLQTRNPNFSKKGGGGKGACDRPSPNKMWLAYSTHFVFNLFMYENKLIPKYKLKRWLPALWERYSLQKHCDNAFSRTLLCSLPIWNNFLRPGGNVVIPPGLNFLEMFTKTLKISVLPFPVRENTP